MKKFATIALAVVLSMGILTGNTLAEKYTEFAEEVMERVNR